MSSTDVLSLSRDDVVWPFHKPVPYVRIGGGHRHQVEIDPTPAYAHDRATVAEVLRHVSEAFPVSWPVSIYLLPHEEIGRTNGATYTDVNYDGPKDSSGAYSGRAAAIFFSAKRIPIHPATTRYLVPHEYGHVVEEWVNERAGNKLWDGALMREYAEMRGLEGLSAYGAGLWHRVPGEVFANDFRVLVCDIEAEYWPHPGIIHPNKLGQDHPVVRWWATLVSEVTMEQAA